MLQGKRAIPWEIRCWFSEYWVALAVCTPIAVGFGAMISILVCAFLGWVMAFNVSFAVLLCDFPVLVWFLWISRSKKVET